MLSWQCPQCGADLLSTGEDRLRCEACGADAERRSGYWRFGDGFRPAGYPGERHPSLAAMTEGHFWFDARERLVIHLLRRRLAEGPASVLDLGCGTGRLLAALERAGWAAAGVDGHPEPLAAAARRAPGATLVHADVCRLPFAAEQFDAVVALDVLEHVEPEPFLREAGRVARPGGGLLLAVPALPRLWSRMDELAGHRCRYTVRQLGRELAAAGWTLKDWTHYQFVLLPLVFLSRTLARRAERPLERRPPAWLDRFLARVNRAEVRLFRNRRLPWGSSIVAWGGRPS